MELNFYNKQSLSLVSNIIVVSILLLVVLIVIITGVGDGIMRNFDVLQVNADEQQCNSMGYRNYDKDVYCDNNEENVGEELLYLICDIESEEYQLFQEVKEYTEDEGDCTQIGDEDCTCIMNAFMYQRDETDKLLERNNDDESGGIGGIIGDRETGQEEGEIFGEHFGMSTPGYEAITKSRNMDSYIKRAQNEYEKWNSNDWDENSPEAYNSLEKYWNATGWDEDQWTQSGQPWSAAFISYVVNGDFSSTSHWEYIKQIKNNNVINWEFSSPYKNPVEVGDIVCRGRKNEEGEMTTLKKVEENNYETSYTSHCDIVVNIENKKATVIGGNLDNRVDNKIIDLNENNYLIKDDGEYIAILKGRGSNYFDINDGLVKDMVLELSNKYNIESSKLMAIVEIESSGKAFYDNGHPIVRFECHIFNNPRRGTQYPLSSSSRLPCTIGEEGFSLVSSQTGYQAFMNALEINKERAIFSTSFGLGQVMGFNYNSAGYSSLNEMYEAMFSKNEQLRVVMNYILSNENLLKELQKENTNWDTVARIYNGAGYKNNNYHVKLETAYNKYS